MIPGEIRTSPGWVSLNEGEVPEDRKYWEDRRTLRVVAENEGDRPIQVGSHLHVCEVNSALKFRFTNGWMVEIPSRWLGGYRLDIPAGTSVRLTPRTSRVLTLVAFGGSQSPPDLVDDTEIKDAFEAAKQKNEDPDPPPEEKTDPGGTPGQNPSPVESEGPQL